MTGHQVNTGRTISWYPRTGAINLDTRTGSRPHPQRGLRALEQLIKPRYAAYLNLIEPWWKVLGSLALAGHCFAIWDEVAEAVAQATDYWNAHRHPFTWGQRRRHHPRRQPGIALLPNAASHAG